MKKSFPFILATIFLLAARLMLAQEPKSLTQTDAVAEQKELFQRLLPNPLPAARQPSQLEPGEVCRIMQRPAQVTSVAVSPDGKLLLSAASFSARPVLLFDAS